MKSYNGLAAADRSLTKTEAREGSPENPSVDINDPDNWGAFGAEASDSGVRVGHKGALKFAPWFRGINLISSLVGKLPLHVYKSLDGDAFERFRKHAAYKLLRHCACRERFLTAYTFKQTLTSRALSTGNGYAYIDRSERDGTPLDLLPLSSQATHPVRVNGRLWYVTAVGGEQRKLDPSNVLHIRGLGDDLEADDVVTLARNAIGLGLAGEKFGSKTFKNGARPGVVIEHPGKMSIRAATKLAESWNRIHSGLDNAHKTAVLEEGAKANAISFNAQEAQLLEMRGFQVRDIANFLGLPPHKLGDPSRTAFASLEQENQSLLDDCLDPWLVAWESECREKLLTEEEKDEETAFIEFNRGALVRANKRDQNESISISLGGRPWRTQNEARRLDNLPPIKGGDTVLEPLNMAKLGSDPNKKDKEQKSLGARLRDEYRDSLGRGRTRRERRGSRRPRPGAGDRRVTLPADVTRRLLLDCLGRMARRLGTQARRATKEPAKFTDWLDAAADENRSTIVEACDAAVRTVSAAQGKPTADDVRTQAIADRLLTAFRAEVDAVVDKATRDELAAEVDRRLTAFEESWPTQAAQLILNQEV